MKFLNTILIGLFTLVTPCAWAQIEEVIVEKYYVSDANDVTDTDGGGVLPEGSVTYRIYVDLADDAKLQSIYGDENHPLKFSTTTKFYNQLDRGEIYGWEVRTNKLDENTLALDSWISINYASDESYGVLKEEDTDGSIVGGEENDGGSEGIAGGLLVNEDADAGIPLTAADGLLFTENLSDYTTIGFDGIGFESNIFSVDTMSVFESDIATISTSGGVVGPNPENRILLAQLTTDGELSFELNLEVWVPNEFGELYVVDYVANDSILVGDELFSNWLSYPPSGGCTDPYYLEYDPAAILDDGSCETLAVLGCTDPEACNYDDEANMNLQALCCYVGGDCYTDIEIVCPGAVGIDDLLLGQYQWEVYPNPANEMVNLKITSPINTGAQLLITNMSGILAEQLNWNMSQGENNLTIDTQNLSAGSYIITILTNEGVITKPLVIVH